MAVVIKTAEIQYKDDNGQYRGVNLLAERKLAEQEAELDAAIAASQDALDTIEEQKNNIAESVASMVELGTDTSLSTPGMAADAKATGDKIRAEKQALHTTMTNETEQTLNGMVTDVDIDEETGVMTVQRFQAEPRSFDLQNGLAFETGYVDGENYLHFTENGEDVEGFTPFKIPAGGGGGGSVDNVIMLMTSTTGWTGKTVMTNTPVVLSFTWSSVLDDAPTGDGAMIVAVNKINRMTRNVAQGEFSVDVTSYLTIGTNRIEVTITDNYGNNRTRNFKVEVQEMYLTSTFDPSIIQDGDFDFSYTPYGGLTKTMHFEVDGHIVKTLIVASSGRTQNYHFTALEHGAHTLRVWFTVTMNEETMSSNELYYEIICIEEGVRTPIIACSYNPGTVRQYTTDIIPFMVYTPSSQTSDVSIFMDGEPLQTLTEVDRTMQQFTYRYDTLGTPTEWDEDEQPIAGTHRLIIASTTAMKAINVTVTKVDINVSAETNGLALNLSPVGRSNNEEHPDTWVYENIEATFSGFNWVTDGWQQDSDGDTALRLTGTDRVTIPYKIFQTDFRPTGKTIEIDFATRDVKNYDQPFFSCMSGNRGITLAPQQAVFKSEQTSVAINYKDEDHIRLTITVEKRNEHRLLTFYLNAVPSRVIQYMADDDFSQMSPVNITIGSDYCTTDIYGIRVYDMNLNRIQVLNNWIADTQNGYTMLERYSRNDLYDDYGKIVMSKLPDNLPYMVLEAEQLPQYKGDKKTITGRYVDPLHPEKSFTFTGCQINVQGTSSAPYARKNYDMQYKNGFMMQSGLADNYALSDTVLPFNRFVLKADVASSEGANNVELVKLYCELTPYKTREMQANSKVRQGIYGFPIVVFWTDKTSGETSFLGKYNFNLPKRAPEPYGYSGDMESWEFQNNTSNLMLFKTDFFDETMYTDPETGETKERWRYDYEARFPSDEWVDYSKLQELESFIYSTYRANATGNALSSPVTYNGVTYTTDTSEYRLAKFKAEFGNYAEVQSFIFYYVFTETFLMVDSRAKNLFIGFSGSDTNPSLGLTIDRKAVCEPYDMDTALGINNVGALTFSYNLEDTDLVGGEFVFNGQDSVLWNNLRDAFDVEIRAMYQTLRSNGAFSYANIEKRFEDHQSFWPEAIWIEDSQFKYIDPLIAPDPGKESTAVYLPMMLGSKLEQRRWWLINRMRYMDSKWNAGDALVQVIQLRGYNKANITVTPYYDIYATVKYGSYLEQERATRGVPVTLPCRLDTMNDTEIYIYSAPQISDVGDLSPLKPGLADFSYAMRIQRVKVGDSDPNYSNPNMYQLTLGTNPLVTVVDARNCVGLGLSHEGKETQSAVDLSGCTALEEAYFTGTSLASVSLPNGGVLKKLHLPETITNLTIRNQSGITEFVVGDAQNPDYSNITTLWLENVSNAVNTWSILDAIPANSRVRLWGFDFSIGTPEDILDFCDLLDTMRGLDQNGQNVAKAQVYGTIRTGTITGAQVAEIKSRYPDITIQYQHLTAIITYCYQNGTKIDSEIVQDGGNASHAPQSIDTYSEEGYIYSGLAGWTTEQGSETIDPNALKNVNMDRTVYAIPANKTLITYTITFVRASEDGGGTLQTRQMQYGQMAAYTGSEPRTTKTSGEWVFDGWTPELHTVNGNQTYIAKFRDTSSITRKYLQDKMPGFYSNSIATCIDKRAFYSNSRIQNIEFLSVHTIGTYAFYTCSRLFSVNFPQVRSIDSYAFAACIILSTAQFPLIERMGSNAFYGCYKLANISFHMLSEIGESAFYNCSELTSVNFSLLTYINKGVFAWCSKLSYVSVPNVTVISSNAFQYCLKLESLYAPNVTIIGSMAFGSCWALSEAAFSLVSIIDRSAFTNCSNLASISFPIADTIGSSAFLSCNRLTEVSFPNAISIGNSAFCYCSDLSIIRFGNAQFVGQNVFNSCSNLSAIIFTNNYIIPSLAANFSISGSPNAIIYVPDLKVNEWRTASRWSAFSNRITGISEMPM